MQHTVTEIVTISAVAKHAGIVMFGAIVHATMAHRKGMSKTFIDFVILTVMSSFSGVMFALLALYLFGDSQPYITLMMAGTGGFLGVEGMTIIVNKLRQLLVTT